MVGSGAIFGDVGIVMAAEKESMTARAPAVVWWNASTCGTVAPRCRAAGPSFDLNLLPSQVGP